MAHPEGYIWLPELLAEVQKHYAIEARAAQDRIVEAHRLGDLDLAIRHPDGWLGGLWRDIWRGNWRQLFDTGVIQADRWRPGMGRMYAFKGVEPCRIYGTRQNLDSFLGIPERGKPGPAPNTLGRYDEADRAIFPDVDRLMATGLSRTAATEKLADDKRVAGEGTAKSRARRLAILHKKERG